MYVGVSLEMAPCHSQFSFATENKTICCFVSLWIPHCVFYLLKHIYLMPVIHLNVFFFSFYFLNLVSRIKFKISLNFKRQKMNICASLVT